MDECGVDVALQVLQQKPPWQLASVKNMPGYLMSIFTRIK
jgi:hypothetical protein